MRKYSAGAGRDYERKVKRFLMMMGFFAMRSAGSHGPFDVVAIDRDQVLFIQCKLGSSFPSNEELNTLYSLGRKYGAVPIIAVGPRPSNMYKIIAKGVRAGSRKVRLEKCCPWVR